MSNEILALMWGTGRSTINRLIAVLGLLALTACAAGAPKGDAGNSSAVVAGNESLPQKAEYASQGFDQIGAQRLVAQAQEALKNGELAAAEQGFLEAVDAWPLSRPAWTGLAEMYQRQGRQDEGRVARFFASRLDWANKMPPLVSAGAFENAAEGEVPVARESPEIRRRSRQLVAFLHEQDAPARDGLQGDTTEIWKLIPAAVVSLIGSLYFGALAIIAL